MRDTLARKRIRMKRKIGRREKLIKTGTKCCGKRRLKKRRKEWNRRRKRAGRKKTKPARVGYRPESPIKPMVSLTARRLG